MEISDEAKEAQQKLWAEEGWYQNKRGNFSQKYGAYVVVTVYRRPGGGFNFCGRYSDRPHGVLFSGISGEMSLDAAKFHSFRFAQWMDDRRR